MSNLLENAMSENSCGGGGAIYDFQGSFALVYDSLKLFMALAGSVETA